MLAPILTTKLYIPLPRDNVVLRSHLIERLNEGLRRKLTLVSAPAGFGKTTLLSEWISALTPGPSPTGRGEGVRAAWLSLDEGENDPARFWSHFIAALQAFAPNIGAWAMGALQSPQAPPIESILASLLNDIVAIPDDFILVLDDYHAVDSKQIDQALAFLVERLPPKMHLVMATREDPDLPLARWRARDQLVELRVKDLRFTASEAAGFLNQTMGLHLSTEDVAALEIRTEGWIAGLQLAALSMQGLQDTAGFIQSFTGSHRFVLDYLLEEVLHKQPENIQMFLLQTSILERMCGQLCDAVLLSSSTAGQEILEYLERANLFIVSLDNERRWYRYHQLFAELLQQRLSQAVSDMAEYHVRASQWYEAHGFAAEAFHHAIAAKDFARAADVAERAWQSMDDTFQTAAWLGWIKQLPEEVIRVRPVLCAQIGWAFSNAGKPETSELYLQYAERALTGAADRIEVKPLPGSIALARAYNAQAQGNLADTVKYAERAAQLIPADDVYRRAQAAITLNFTHWAAGNLEAARQAINDWMASMTRLGNHVFVVASAFAAADILIEQGRLRDAMRTYEQAVQLAAEAGPEAQAITAHHHLGLALLYRELGNAESFAQHWQKAEELGKQTTLVDWPHRWCLAQARVKESEGDFDAALDLLDEAKQVYVKNPVPDLRPIAALKAQVYLKQGRLTQAQDWAHERGLAADDDLSYLHEFEYLTLARILIAEYQTTHADRALQDALRLLDRLRHAAETGQRAGSVVEILITQALAYRAQGDSPAALAVLERALTLAEPEGYVRLFVDEGEAMRLLILDFGHLHRAADAVQVLWIEKQGQRASRKIIEYAHRLLADFKQPAAGPQSKVQNPKSEIFDPLSPRELEVLRLIEQGLSNQEIADRLFLALSTVKGYTRTIFDKLQVQRRTEAIARARELGLL